MPAGHPAGYGLPVKAAHGKGHTRKHARAGKKHSGTSKHRPAHQPLTAHQKHLAHLQHIHAKAKHPTHAKARALALDAGDVGCCTAEALAASLRCQGLSVPDDAVLDLFRAAGGDEDAGLPILATLEAAAGYGLAGFRPRFEPVPLTADIRRPLLLGLELPGPHAVVATPDGWWSWGELYCPWCEWPDAVIEEAWAVTWG